MKTAHLHLDNVPGHGVYSRCYKLDEPHIFGREERHYVTITVHEEWTHVEAEITLVPSLSTGACAERAVKRYPGSFTLHGNPLEDKDALEFCFHSSLQMLGYAIVEAP